MSTLILLMSVLTFDAHVTPARYIQLVRPALPRFRMSIVIEGEERYRVLIDKNRDGHADVVIRVDGRYVTRDYGDYGTVVTTTGSELTYP